VLASTLAGGDSGGISSDPWIQQHMRDKVAWPFAGWYTASQSETATGASQYAGSSGSGSSSNDCGFSGTCMIDHLDITLISR
jgi:hypothetical protein